MERGYNTITFILAGTLAAIVLGAIAYGVSNPSRIVSAVPFGSHHQLQRAAPDRSAPAPASTIGAGPQSRQAPDKAR